MADTQFQRFSDRFFQVSPLYTQPGWYIKLRENKVLGPYPSKEAAQMALFNLFGVTGGARVAQTCEATVRYSTNSRR